MKVGDFISDVKKIDSKIAALKKRKCQVKKFITEGVNNYIKKEFPQVSCQQIRNKNKQLIKEFEDSLCKEYIADIDRAMGRLQAVKEEIS